MNLKDRMIWRVKEISVGESIDSTREVLFESVIVILCVLGFVAVIMGGLEVSLQGRAAVVFVYIAAYLPVLACLFLKNKMAYHIRVGIVLMDVYLLSILILAGVGLSGAGIPLLITFSVLATTFLGIRAGLVSVALSFAGILAIGAGMSSGMIPIDVVTMTNSTRIEAWLMAAVLFLVIGGVMVICPGILQNSLQKTIDIIRDKTADVEASNRRLKKALTDREEMEKKLIRAEKMEAMGLLAGGVAHDLNNILSGVTTYPELLLYNLPVDHELYDPLKMIKSSGDKAATIVRDLLTLSRRGVNVKETVNLGGILDECLQSPEYEKLCFFHPDVSVDIDMETDLANISGSPVHLSNVLMNLISNAAEAMPRGGRIRIRGRNVILDEERQGYEIIPKGVWVLLSVADTGPGILEEDMEHLFEPFFTKKKMGRSGTGLGMAIVMGSVKDHRGYIDIKSESGNGTRITLYFPASDSPLEPEKKPFEIERVRGRGQTILFVDDVKQQREIAQGVLIDLGYTPHCLESGEAALEYCRTRKPDLLVVDMIMDPGMDGYTTLKQIREIHPGLTAVIISGYSETEKVKAALELGSALFLKKPYTIESFAVAVHKSLGQHRSDDV